MSYSLKGYTVILSGCLSLLVAGCGTFSRGHHDGERVIPVSHVRCAETALVRAFDAMKIPEGRGEKIKIDVAVIGETTAELVSVIAPEALLKYGYIPVSNGQGGSKAKVTVDSLTVTLTSEGKFRGKTIIRNAYAALTVEIAGDDGARKVYRGIGSNVDRYESGLIQKEAAGEPFIRDERSGGWYITVLKPLVIGVTMTIFTWALYSYRG